jgi:predicted amidohydrolase YtcJ
MRYGFFLFLVFWATLLPLRAQLVADTVLLNGRVFTSDPAKPDAEAIAIRGDRIAAVGSADEIRRLIGEKTKLLDLGGRIVVPGFNDAHAHFGPTFKGIELKFEAQEPSWDQTLAVIKQAVSTAPKGEWIFGTVGDVIINDPRASRDTLDRIAPDNPVLLSTYFGHGAIINSQGLKAFKISDSVRDPMGGRFERDKKTRRLTGRMFEYAAWNLDRILTEQGTDEQLISDIQKRAAVAASLGITSMQIMPGISTSRFVRILAKAQLPIRVRAIAFSRTVSNGRDLTDVRSLGTLKPVSPNVSVGGLKWILDGTPLERGAAMRTAYLDRPGFKGYLNFSQPEVEKFVRESLDLDQQLLVHAVGDRAVETLLNAMEKVGAERKVDWPSKRVRIEHGEGVAGELVERCKKLGIIVVQNPSHFTVVNEIYTRWGKDTKFSSQRSLITAGVRYALGSDGPVNPFLNIMFAVIHPARPAEAITREEAVRAYTYGSSFAEFSETRKGMLKPGMLADLAVLSQDIFAIPVESLPATESVLTMVGGRVVHDSNVVK